MSVDQARAFVNRVLTDPEFVERLEAAPPAERRGILTEEGYGDVRLMSLTQALPQSAGGELSDEEFAAVAGGVNTTNITWAVGTGVGGAVTSVMGSIVGAMMAF